MEEQEDLSTSEVFLPPSVNQNRQNLVEGKSYCHYSPVPTDISTAIDVSGQNEQRTPCVLGVDEAGRGPVIGPMIYGIFYLPIELQSSLLTTKYHFDDSKILTPTVRANLMKAVCSQGTDLYQSCGWAVKSLSAQDIGAGMLKNGGAYNLNAQAMDATVELIRGVIDQGVNVREIYVDTIGAPAVYQQRLERIFPNIRITVAKKADSLYPCVSAASVVAKVTRDVSCEVLYSEYAMNGDAMIEANPGWGSGYPSDARCVSWLKKTQEPMFGWGNECRFSWGTVKDMLETRSTNAPNVEWPDDGDEDTMKLSQFFMSGTKTNAANGSEELSGWYGVPAGREVF